MFEMIKSDIRRHQTKFVQRGYSSRRSWIALFNYSFILLFMHRIFAATRGTLIDRLFIRSIFECTWSVLSSSEFSSGAKLGRGALILHGYGLVVNSNAVIGENVTLYHRVTIGVRFPGDGSPVVGDRVVVGTGACVLGPVVIPDGSLIPANSVITPSSMCLIQVLKKDSGLGFID